MAAFLAFVVAAALLAGFMSGTVGGYTPNLDVKIRRLEDRMLEICESSDEYKREYARTRFLCTR